MPELSVVIPTVGRPVLARTLERLERQEGAGDFEVLVVDSPPDGDAAELLAGRRLDVRRVAREQPGVAHARNLGWRAARAPVVLFLGDDILAAPDLLVRHLAFHREHPADADALLGHVRWADELRVTPFMRWLERSGTQFDYGSIPGERAGWWHFYTANVSVKRALLERAGGFDEDFEFAYEDLELGCRMDAHGLRLAYDPAAGAEHLHAERIGDWEARMALVARGERLMAAKHPGFRPHFHRLFAEALERPARGRGARLAGLIGPETPWLGPRVWASYDLACRRRLAPAFLAAWDAQEASSGGSPPGGPK